MKNLKKAVVFVINHRQAIGTIVGGVLLLLGFTEESRIVAEVTKVHG